MADIIGLDGQRAAVQQEDQDYRQRGVKIALDEIMEGNVRGEVRSFVGFVVDYQGRVHTSLSREFVDDVVLLGALEIFKSDLLAKLRERREFESTPVPEEPEDA